jgi:steroid delta-isomerase-like uncharacterized protein
MSPTILAAAVLALTVLGPASDPAENRRLAVRYFDEILSQGRIDVADELLSAEVRFRNPPVTLTSRDDFKQLVRALRAAFPDLKFKLEDTIAEGDRVATRWTMTGTHLGELPGRAPTGKTMTVSGMDIFHIAGGRIQEIWVNMDSLGQAQQLGWLAPAPPRDK